MGKRKFNGRTPITPTPVSGRGGNNGRGPIADFSGRDIRDFLGDKTPTLQPGQSVLPGSIDVPTYGLTHSAATPENVWWSQSEVLNTIDSSLALLNNMNNGGSLGQGYASIFQNIIDHLKTNGNAALNPDWLISLFQNLLQYQTTQDQRSYDWMLKQDQRNYDNPQNELARLMGAGISRDAALQLMSGSAGNLGGGSATGAAVASPVAGAGAAALNSSNAHANLVNNVYNGLQMVGNLVSQGFSVAQSIQQVQSLGMQNYMSQQQIQSYDAVNQVTQALQNMLNQGIITQDDFDSWKNGNDVQKWLLDHMDTKTVAPLFQSGAMQRAFGSTYGREMFNNHWQQQNRGRTDGEILDLYVKSLHLQNDIAAIQPDYIAAEMENLSFQNLHLDAQSQLFYQNITESMHRVELIDKQGNKIDVDTAAANLDLEYNQAGFPMLKQNRIYQLQLQVEKWSALFGENPNIPTYDPVDGVDHKRDHLDEVVLSYLTDAEALRDIAYLKFIDAHAVGNFAKDHPGLYALCRSLNALGVFDYVKLGSTAALQAGLMAE